MKKISLKNVTIGNFQYDGDIEVTEEVEQALLKQGALRVLQGAPSGAWEKSLAYPGDKEKRPKDFNRKSIGFSEEAAAALEAAYKAATVNVAGDDEEKKLVNLGVTGLLVTEYTGAVAAEPKYADQKALLKAYLFEVDGTTSRKLKSGEARTAATFAESRGIVAPTEPWVEDIEFLKAVKEWQKEQAVED